MKSLVKIATLTLATLFLSAAAYAEAPVSTDSLVGKWVIKTITNRHGLTMKSRDSSLEFTTDGLMKTRRRFSISANNYSVEGDHIILIQKIGSGVHRTKILQYSQKKMRLKTFDNIIYDLERS